MLAVIQLSLFNLASFRDFATEESWREWLTTADTSMVMLGALLDEQAAGLAIGMATIAGVSQLLWIYVPHQFRGRGLGSVLLRQLESECAMRGSPVIETSYGLDLPAAGALERTFRRCGWREGARLNSFVVDGRIMSAAWFARVTLPAGYTISPWDSVTSAELDGLVAAQATDSWIPSRLSPHRYFDGLDAGRSLALRRNGRLEGWVLTTVVDEHTVHYRNVFVRPTVPRTAGRQAALGLLAEAIRRQVGQRGVTSRGRFGVLDDNKPLLRFIQRHMSDGLVSSSKRVHLAKRLGQKSSVDVI